MTVRDVEWIGGSRPLDEPVCGFASEKCVPPVGTLSQSHCARNTVLVGEGEATLHYVHCTTLLVNRERSRASESRGEGSRGEARGEEKKRQKRLNSLLVVR